MASSFSNPESHNSNNLVSLILPDGEYTFTEGFVFDISEQWSVLQNEKYVEFSLTFGMKSKGEYIDPRLREDFDREFFGCRLNTDNFDPIIEQGYSSIGLMGMFGVTFYFGGQNCCHNFGNHLIKFSFKEETAARLDDSITITKVRLNINRGTKVTQHYQSATCCQIS